MDKTPQEIFQNNKVIGAIDKSLSIAIYYLIIILEKISFGKGQGVFVKIKKNGALLNNIIGLTVFNAIGGLLIIATQVKIANVLGPTSYGLYSYCLAIGEVGSVFVRYGRSKTMLRDLIQTPEKRNTLITSTFISGLINLLFFIIIVIPLFSVLDFPLTFGCILLIISPTIISLDFQPVYESIMAMSWQSIYNLLQKIFFVTLVWGIIYFLGGINLDLLGCITLLSWILIIIGQYFEISKLYKFNLVNDFSLFEIKNLYKRNFIIAICNFSWVLYQPGLRIILNNECGNESVGVFSAGFQILAIFQFILIQISRVGNPILSKIGSCKYTIQQRRNIVFRYLKIMIAIVSPISVLLIFCSKIITELLFIEKYHNLALILPIFAIYLFANSISIVFEQYLISLRKDKSYFLIFTFGAILTIVIALFLIPYYGVIGAAFAMCFSMVFNAIGYFIVSYQYLKLYK